MPINCDFFAAICSAQRSETRGLLRRPWLLLPTRSGPADSHAPVVPDQVRPRSLKPVEAPDFLAAAHDLRFAAGRITERPARPAQREIALANGAVDFVRARDAKPVDVAASEFRDPVLRLRRSPRRLSAGQGKGSRRREPHNAGRFRHTRRRPRRSLPRRSSHVGIFARRLRLCPREPRSRPLSGSRDRPGRPAPRLRSSDPRELSTYRRLAL